MVVRQLVAVVVRAVNDRDLLVLQIDALHVAEEEMRSLEHLADGIDDVRYVEVTGGHLVQHRRKGEEVLTADEGDLDLRVAAELFFQFDGGVESAEAAAEEQDSGW